jgi:hypothetical protein
MKYEYWALVKWGKTFMDFTDEEEKLIKMLCQVLPDFRMTIISPLRPSGMSNE